MSRCPISFPSSDVNTTAQLSREQTSFVDGVWRERRRLEAELTARREDAERSRLREEAAVANVATMERRLKEMSAAADAAKRDAETAAAAEAERAMEVLRRQLDELRLEVERVKQEQTQVVETTSAQDAKQSRWETLGKDHVWAVSLEAEFQRLRAKYEKAKGRISSLEERLMGARRASAQARREFQAKPQVMMNFSEFYGLQCRCSFHSSLSRPMTTHCRKTCDAKCGARHNWCGARPQCSLSSWSLCVIPNMPRPRGRCIRGLTCRLATRNSRGCESFVV